MCSHYLFFSSLTIQLYLISCYSPQQTTTSSMVRFGSSRIHLTYSQSLKKIFINEPQGGRVRTWQPASSMAVERGAGRSSTSSYQCQSLAPLSGADWQWRRACASWRTWLSLPSPAIHSGPASEFWWMGITCLCSVVRRKVKTKNQACQNSKSLGLVHR